MTKIHQKNFNIKMCLIIFCFILSNNNLITSVLNTKKDKLLNSNDELDKKDNNKSERIWNKLRGSWKKVSFKEKDNNEFIDYDWHIGGDLYLIYDGLGGCSIISQSKNYSISYDQIHNERLDLIPKSESYYYFANCKINNDTIEHHKILHSNPKEVGEIAKRQFKLISNYNNKMLDTLILIPLNFKNYTELKLIRVN